MDRETKIELAVLCEHRSPEKPWMKNKRTSPPYEPKQGPDEEWRVNIGSGLLHRPRTPSPTTSSSEESPAFQEAEEPMNFPTPEDQTLSMDRNQWNAHALVRCQDENFIHQLVISKNTPRLRHHAFFQDVACKAAHLRDRKEGTFARAYEKLYISAILMSCDLHMFPAELDFVYISKWKWFLTGDLEKDSCHKRKFKKVKARFAKAGLTQEAASRLRFDLSLDLSLPLSISLSFLSLATLSLSLSLALPLSCDKTKYNHTLSLLSLPSLSRQFYFSPWLPEGQSKLPAKMAAETGIIFLRYQAYEGMCRCIKDNPNAGYILIKAIFIPNPHGRKYVEVHVNMALYECYYERVKYPVGSRPFDWPQPARTDEKKWSLAKERWSPRPARFARTTAPATTLSFFDEGAAPQSAASRLRQLDPKVILRALEKAEVSSLASLSLYRSLLSLAL
jgi:hypothetical protein